MTTDAATATSPSPALEPTEHGLAVERDFMRNALVGMIFEAVWALGMSFAISAVLIPAYLGELAAPRSVIGIAASLKTLCVPIQLLSERLIGGTGRKRRLWMAFTAQGLSFVVLGLIASVLPAEPKAWRIVNFVLLMIAFYVADALATPMYYAVLTDNCPVRRRGRLYGVRSVAMGGLGLAGLYPAKWILAQFSGASAYHAAVIIAGSMFSLATLILLFGFRDHIDPQREQASRSTTSVRQVMAETWALLRRLWHGPNYRIFMFFMVILFGSVSLGPFIITYSRDVLGAVDNVSERFQMVYLAAAMVNGLWIAVVADRWGYQVTLICQACLAILAFSLVQITGQREVVLLAYAMWTALHMGLGVSMLNFSVELIPNLPPAHLMAAGNLFALPVSVLLPWACGSLIDYSRAVEGSPAWGYIVVLTVAAVMALIAGFGIAMLVKEPRSGSLYVIKTLDRA